MKLKELNIITIRYFITVALAILLLIAASLEFRKIYRLEQIAKDLLEVKKISDFSSNQNHPVAGVVNIGPSLYEMIRHHQTNNDSFTIRIENGDVFSEDHSITHSILYESEKSGLGLRMRYDWTRDRFHIVGFSGKID